MCRIVVILTRDHLILVVYKLHNEKIKSQLKY